MSTSNVKLKTSESAKNVKEVKVEFASASSALKINGSQVSANTSPTLTLTVKDASTTDSKVSSAVATFDIDATYGTTDVTNLSPSLKVTMTLDTTKFDADDYYVYRNHEGTVTLLSGTSYSASSGKLVFTSDKFSKYSLVEKPDSSSSSSTTSTSTTSTSTSTTSTSTTSSSSTLAKTGDPLDAMPFVVLGIAALAIVGFALRELRRAE